MEPRISRLLLAWFLAGIGAVTPPLVAAERSRPNVVVLLADDAGWGDYSRSGNPHVSTPHIDSIASRGVSLERFYVCPMCSPTRAEFLTGRYYPRTGVRGVDSGRERMDLSENTIADAFKAAGYATGAFGKWHNGAQWPYHPTARGFDEFFGYTAGHWGEYFNPPLERNGRMERASGYIVDVCTEKALDFIDRNKARPFFCYIPFTTPHTPWAVPPEYWERFKDKPIPATARCALAMMENQDWNVGRVLGRLRELGLENDTLVIYFSDNGPNTPRWNGGMKGIKGSTDEGGVRSVCHMRYPAKFSSGRVVGEISSALDLLPTLTSLAGIGRVGGLPLDGRDLSPLLTGAGGAWPDRMLFSTRGGRVSVRTQTHRMDSEGNLFDMVADPNQGTPIQAKAPELAGQLTEAIGAWRREVLMEPPGTASPKTPIPAVDERMIPVGYREFPVTMLSAGDGRPEGGVRRSSAAPNSSYFTHWNDTKGSMVWMVDVHTSGRYRVSVDYTCPDADAGSTFELSFGEARLSGVVRPGWDPPIYTNQDALPRGGESPMKEFRTLDAGTVSLIAGQGALRLRATQIPGNSVMDVLRVTLTLER
jgi:arylsulfatase A-like enzyme